MPEISLDIISKLSFMGKRGNLAIGTKEKGEEKCLRFLAFEHPIPMRNRKKLDFLAILVGSLEFLALNDRTAMKYFLWF